MREQEYSLFLRLLIALGLKIEPGTPSQSKMFFLFFGLVLAITGCNGLLSAPDHSPGRRWFFQILYEVFGPYGDDYFSFFFGIWLIYFAAFKCGDTKQRFRKR